MIFETKNIDNDLLDKLKNNHYSRRIKSHFYAYGNKYDFSRFYLIEDNGISFGIISVFNSSMMISSFKERSFDDNIINEIAGFIMMNKPSIVELECRYANMIFHGIDSEYRYETRTEFEFVSKNNLPSMVVDEIPKLDNVFNVLKTSFPAIADSYELWITDTSHRIRHGLSQSFLLGDYSTATIQYIIDGTALIGHVATIPEERGNFHARHLLYWIGERLTMDGFCVKLLARPNRVSYYEEIGFKEVGTDIVFERKSINDR
ncbi:MAG: hypothetical protein ACI4I7_00995 [Oscillospiraceae bacterium]